METGSLKAKIASENRVNALVNDYAPAIFNNAKDLVGKPVFKADGSLRLDALKILDLPKVNHPDTLFLNRSKYNLSFTFKTCCQEPHENPAFSDHCSYAETTVYIGDVENGILVTLKDPEPPHKTDYTLKEVRAAQAEAARAKEAYEKARAACFPFGET